MEANAFPTILAYCSSVNDLELAPVPERTTLTGYSHPAKCGATEVEVSVPIAAGPAGALVRHNYGDGASRANALVLALHLEAFPTPLPLLEQHWAHCSHPRLQRLHVH